MGVGSTWSKLVLFNTKGGFNNRVQIGTDNGYTLLNDTNYTVNIYQNSTSIFINLKTSSDNTTRATINSTDTNFSSGYVGEYSWDSYATLYAVNINYVIATCQFAGYVKDSNGNALSGANVSIWNSNNFSESYQTTSDGSGYFSVNIPNSTNTYNRKYSFNNGTTHYNPKADEGVSGTC